MSARRPSARRSPGPARRSSRSTAASVTVTASRSDLEALRRAGFKVVARARAADFPGADAGYHNYTEMTAEINAIAAAHPGLVSVQRIGQSYQGRDLTAIKISDNVATDEPEPEVLFTSGQHAREHLTIEMALYLAHQLAESADLQTYVNTREIWIVAEHEPGRQRVRRRVRLVPVVAQEPPAERRIDGRGHRPQPQLGLQLGLLRRLVRHLQLGDLPRRVPVLRARDPGRAELRQQPRDRRRPADQDQHRLPYLFRARPVALRLHDRGHRARRSAPTRRTRSRRSAGRWPRRTGTRPSRRQTSTSPTARSTTGSGTTTDLRLHVRDVPALLEPRVLPARRGDRRPDEPQPAGGRAAAELLGLPAAHHRPDVRRAGAGDDLRRRLRDGEAVHVRRHGDDRPVRDRRPGGDDLQRRQAARDDRERDA